MGMTRQERISLHKKQERLQVANGVPSVTNMKEGVPELRYVEGTGLTEYTRFNNILHEKVLDKSNIKEVISPNRWYDAILENSWVAYGATWSQPQYCIDKNGFVHIKGLVKDGSSATADIFSLPEGFRPSKRAIFICSVYAAAGDNACRVDIDVDGDVFGGTGAETNWISLDGITFEGV